MSAEPNLLLIGLRGSGKTTVARALALRQHRAFFDLDEITPTLLGCASVAEAWASRGEPAFREAESRALAQTLGAHHGAIIALGGGAPTAPGAAELIEREAQAGRARVVYLRCTPELLAARLRSIPGGPGPSRPSLTGADPIDEIATVFAQRDPLYQRLATRTLENLATLDDALAALEDWNRWQRSR